MSIQFRYSNDDDDDDDGGDDDDDDDGNNIFFFYSTYLRINLNALQPIGLKLKMNIKTENTYTENSPDEW